jgi:hypothetical protein
MKKLSLPLASRQAKFTSCSRQLRQLAVASRFLLVLISLLAAMPVAQAQTPSWQAAQSLNQAAIGGNIYGYKTAVDASGNTLVAGYFSGKVVVGNTTLISAGIYNIFVGKLDATGNWLWVTHAGGSLYDLATDVTVDASGNIFVTGVSWAATTQFGSINLTVNGRNTFVAKLDRDGNWLWVKASTSNYDDGRSSGFGIVTDASGNVIVTGRTGGTVNFGSTTITVIGNWDNGYVAKLDADGNWLWAKGFGGTAQDGGNDVAVDDSGNIFLTGSFTTSASFGNIWVTEGESSNVNMFVAELTGSGSWSWVEGIGGAGIDQGQSVAVDASGNIFALGTYTGTVGFGGTHLTSVGSEDIAVLKLSNSGKWLWAKSAGGSNSDQAGAIALDAKGNALLTGTFTGSINFGSTNLISSGNTDNLAVAKISSDGTWSWARNASGSGSGLAVDASGNAVVTGTFTGSTTYGSTTLASNDNTTTLFVAKTNATSWLWATQADTGASTDITATVADTSGNTLIVGSFSGIASFGNSTLASAGESDGFVAKRDASGNWLWAKKLGGTARDRTTSVALDASGNILLTGSFSGTASFGTTTLSSTAPYGTQLFVAKLNATGNWLWTRAPTGVDASFEGSGSVATDGSGNILLTGGFSGTASFGTTSLTSTTQYGTQLFVSKLDATGNWLWAKAATGAGEAQGRDIKLDRSGNALVTGYFTGTASFGNTNLSSNDQYTYNVFVTKLDAAGSWLWAKGASSSTHVQGVGVALDTVDNVLVTGSFNGTASFGSTSLSSTVQDGATTFVTKLSPSGTWLWAQAATSAGDNQPTALLSNDSGNAIITGFYKDAISFGSTNLPNEGSNDIFVAQLDNNGAWLWAKSAGGSDNDQATSLALDASDNILVGGQFSSSTNGVNASSNFESLTIEGPALGNTGFIAQLASPLTIVSFTPDNGLTGTRVVLTGRGFTSVSSVSFNGTSAPGFVVNSAAQIIVDVPTDATTGPISVVTTAGTAVSAQPFIVPTDLIVNTPQAIGGTYRNVTVTGTGTATLATDLTVLGTLTVQSSGQLNANTHIVTGSSFVLADGGTLSIGSPAGITATGNTGSIQTTTRAFSSNANYVYGSRQAGSETGSGLPAQVRSLSVVDLSGGAANVKLTNGLAIAHTLRLDYDLVTNGKALTLLSTPLAGSALVYNNGGVVVGTATVQRAIDPTLNSGLGYRHFSAPVSNSTVADLATAGFTPVINSVYNTSAAPTAETPFPTVYNYDQSRLVLANNLTSFDKGWVSPASLNEVLTVGKGYTVNLSASEVVDFVGTLNNGTFSVPMSRVADATAVEAGWQLIGNPYPAPLDLSLVAPADRNNLDAAMYVSQSLGQYTSQYHTYVNGFSTDAANSSVVPSGQGFFVRVSAGQTSGSFIFRNSQRQTTFDAITSMQHTTADTRPQVHLTLRGAGPVSDAVIVYFESGATAGLDVQYDATKLPNTTGLNLSTTSATGQALAIDGRALPTSALTIPLNVYVPATGTYTLQADQLLNFNGLRPYLRDIQLGTLTDLSQQPSYSFSQNELFTGARFELVLMTAQPLAATLAAQAQLQVAVYPNPARTVAFVELPAVLSKQLVKVTLLDALGREVRTTLLAAQDVQAHQLSLAGLPAGVYALHLHTCAGVVTKRLVIE